MEQEQIFSLDILSTNPWVGFVEKYKHPSIRLTKLREKTALATFVMRWALLSQFKSLDCGSYLDINVERYFSENITAIQIDSIDQIFDNLKEFIGSIGQFGDIKLCKYIMIILAYLFICSKSHFVKFSDSIDLIAESKYNDYETYEFDEVKLKRCVPNHKKLETIIGEIKEMIKPKNPVLGKKKQAFASPEI
jgi:hypothetical protein